jgi:hypothetical protein
MNFWVASVEELLLHPQLSMVEPKVGTCDKCFRRWLRGIKADYCDSSTRFDSV